MRYLDALTVVAKPNMRPVSDQDQKRFKLISRLQEQMQMVEAELTGKTYKRLKWTTRTTNDGHQERVQRAVHVKQWWFKDWAGSMFFAVRYGSKQIFIQKDKSAIKIRNLSELPAAITALIKAVEAGELDAQLASMSNEKQFLPNRSTSKLPVKRSQ